MLRSFTRRRLFNTEEEGEREKERVCLFYLYII